MSELVHYCVRTSLSSTDDVVYSGLEIKYIILDKFIALESVIHNVSLKGLTSSLVMIDSFPQITVTSWLQNDPVGPK